MKIKSLLSIRKNIIIVLIKMVKIKANKEDNIIEIDFGPQKETIKNENGTKIRVSYHLLPNCHDEEEHMGQKYVNYFMKKKYYNNENELIKTEKGLNPNVSEPDANQLNSLEKIAEKDEKLRKEGKIWYSASIM